MFKEYLIKLFELPFAKIILITDSIAEVIVNENVELDLAMVHQFHDFLLAQLVSPFSLLINKLNAYSYNFDAQVNLGNLTEIHAIAVVAYQSASQLNTEYLANSVPRAVAWNIKIYPNRDEALSWLHIEQASIRKLQQSD